MKNTESKTTAVAKVNNTEILVIVANGEKRVAIKPICDALGIASNSQIERIKNDPLLSSVNMTVVSTGADGKQYEMATIPFKFVFGWLFRIDSRNVKPEAKEAVEKYQLECYEALYSHFTELDDYLKYRNELAEQIWDQVEAAREDFKIAKTRLETLKVEFAEARKMTFEDFKNRQLQMQFPEDAVVVDVELNAKGE